MHGVSLYEIDVRRERVRGDGMVFAYTIELMDSQMGLRTDCMKMKSR